MKQANIKVHITVNTLNSILDEIIQKSMLSDNYLLIF